MARGAGDSAGGARDPGAAVGAVGPSRAWAFGLMGLGAVVGGLLVGLVLSYVAGYLGAGTTPLAVLGLLVVVLLARPAGLFSGAQARRV